MNNNPISYLSRAGKTDYAVLIPADATPAVRQAAEEFAEYFLRVTGGAIDVVEEGGRPVSLCISVGNTKCCVSTRKTPYPDLNTDGFIIRTAGKNLIVDAGSDRGFLYGTYEILEKFFGVRFLAPEETVIPKKADIPLYETEYRSVPAFRMRTFLAYPVFKLNPDWDYIVHARNLHTWMEPEARYGGGTKVFCRGAGAHNAHFFVPAEKYGTRESTGYTGAFVPGHDPHPEFYHHVTPPPEYGEVKWSEGAFITIDWANGISEDGSLDESMDVSVAKVVIEEMKKDVLAHPEAEYFFFEQEDCIDPVTDKELAEKYTPAGVIIRFCNVIARELQKWADAELGGRTIKIVTFAYNQTQKPPVKRTENGEYAAVDPTVIPADNLVIQLAYGCFQYYPYDSPMQSAVTLETNAGWKAIGKELWFWGYDAVYTDYLVYDPSFGQIDGTVRLMKDMGVQYLHMQSTHDAPNDWQSYMKLYVWSKKMWDVEADVQRLKDEYIDGCYGPAGEYVRKMMAILDAQYDKVVASLGYKAQDMFGPYREIGTAENLTPQTLDSAIEAIETGMQKIRADESLSEFRKDQLYRRLCGVAVTPIWMKLKYFGELYPERTDYEKWRLAIKMADYSRRAGISVMSESATVFEKLRKEFSAS